MKFELHCHSFYSKGSRIPWEGIPSPEGIIRHARKIGLSGIAITDHRTTKAWPSARAEAKKQGIIFIQGVELQTNDGHLIALGISEPVDNFLGIDETLDKIHERGGIGIAVHPFDVRGEGVGSLATKADAIEIFNSLNIDMVGNRYASHRFRNSPLPRVAGSDAHTLGTIGLSVNMMDAHDIDSAIKCIRKGRVSMGTRYTPMNEIVEWTRERFLRSHADVTEYIQMHCGRPKAWLYSRMLKKFLKTGNAPWRAMAEISLFAVKSYGILKVATY